jgi:hypothetical protein
MDFFAKLFRRKIRPKDVAQLGRNDACWCGSGKKYKKCHYQTDQLHLSRVRNEHGKGSYRAK